MNNFSAKVAANFALVCLPRTLNSFQYANDDAAAANITSIFENLELPNTFSICLHHCQISNIVSALKSWIFFFYSLLVLLVVRFRRHKVATTLVDLTVWDLYPHAARVKMQNLLPDSISLGNRFALIFESHFFLFPLLFSGLLLFMVVGHLVVVVVALAMLKRQKKLHPIVRERENVCGIFWNLTNGAGGGRWCQ